VSRASHPPSGRSGLHRTSQDDRRAPHQPQARVDLQGEPGGSLMEPRRNAGSDDRHQSIEGTGRRHRRLRQTAERHRRSAGQGASGHDHAAARAQGAPRRRRPPQGGRARPGPLPRKYLEVEGERPAGLVERSAPRDANVS